MEHLQYWGHKLPRADDKLAAGAWQRIRAGPSSPHVWWLRGGFTATLDIGITSPFVSTTQQRPCSFNTAGVDTTLAENPRQQRAPSYVMVLPWLLLLGSNVPTATGRPCGGHYPEPLHLLSSYFVSLVF